MTDKEQIIIHGVNVSECRNKYICHLYETTEYCKRNPNCYFKQLTRKTQECEELKEKYEEVKEDRYNLNMEMYILDRYRKALEEIEGYIYTDCEYNDGCDRNICIRCKYSNVHDKEILDIISKVKDGKNE